MTNFTRSWADNKHKQNVTKKSNVTSKTVYDSFRNPILLHNMLVHSSKTSGESKSSIIIRALKKLLKVR